MITDLNIPLRTGVLDKALNLEHTVNLILLQYMSIESEERKAITNKNSSLSFKNKIDLLFDLEVFSKDEYKLFLLLMEYRNQFLHNIDCSSFTYAASVLGIDKEKSLLKFDKETTEKDNESRYKNAFLNLYGEIIKIALEKIRQRKQIIEDKSKLLTNLSNKTIYFMDALQDMMTKLFDLYEPKYSDTEEIVKLKTQIFQTIGCEIEKIYSAEELKSLQEKLSNSLTSEKIKIFFK
ncbi:MAG TPA: hypothetical protein VNX01_11770 [Bacteroidia bacterium]|jgi:hypothetical protein|nr:hypothetical protein [Bacteroidia bacterium]